MVPNSVVTSSDPACESGEAYRENRTRSALGCEDETETRFACLPLQSERLILALGLGSTSGSLPNQPNPLPQPDTILTVQVSGIVNPGSNPLFRAVSPTQATTQPPQTSGTQVCQHLTEARGKRDDEVAENEIKLKNDAIIPSDTPHTAIPFNWKEHAHRFRRQSGCSANPSQPKYVLFLLDTSGSISEEDFLKMKTAIHRLLPLFCGSIRVAVMTFNHEYHREFCFDDFAATATGTAGAQTEVLGITYRAGYTHTAGAALCACHQMLHEDCGLPNESDCIEVIFITDGQSNDPTRDVCEEVNCLKERAGVTTHAIGIGNNVDTDELNCIKEATNAFKFDNFDDFLKGIEQIEEKIRDNFRNGDFDACANPNLTYGG